MNQNGWLAERFDGHRAYLRSLAVRILGSASEADTAVQEAWTRLSRVEGRDTENLGGYIVTVTARVCIERMRLRNRLRASSAQAEDPVRDHGEASASEPSTVLADCVGPALLVVLETLPPAERIAWVLRNVLAMSFERIVNRGLAVAMLRGAPAGLDELDAIPERELLSRYPYALATYAELHASLGHMQEARAFLKRALEQQSSPAERALMLRKLAGLE